jgi:pimeloyl-ACP methyl ester carboxylesterase
LAERPTILYFHGNVRSLCTKSSILLKSQAANRAAPHRVRGYSAYSNLDCNVLAVDYRGFGDSTGTPSEKGLIKDARTVWDFVIRHDSGHGIKAEGDRGVILIGQSLGTGVVAGLAGQLAKEGKSSPACRMPAGGRADDRCLSKSFGLDCAFYLGDGIAGVVSQVAAHPTDSRFWLFGFIPLLSPLKSIPWALGQSSTSLDYCADRTLNDRLLPIIHDFPLQFDSCPFGRSRLSMLPSVS